MTEITGKDDTLCEGVGVEFVDVLVVEERVDRIEAEEGCYLTG